MSDTLATAVPAREQAAGIPPDGGLVAGDEVLVIDSGSRDRSVSIARVAGVELLEIPSASFAHAYRHH